MTFLFWFTALNSLKRGLSPYLFAFLFELLYKKNYIGNIKFNFVKNSSMNVSAKIGQLLSCLFTLGYNHTKDERVNLEIIIKVYVPYTTNILR